MRERRLKKGGTKEIKSEKGRQRERNIYIVRERDKERERKKERGTERVKEKE